jgi:hypothetical protein
MPYYEQEKSSDAEWSRDEKVSHAAASLMDLKKRECYLKFPGRDAQHFKVRVVRPLPVEPDERRAYERAVYARTGALPVAEQDAEMARLREELLHRATAAVAPPSTGKKPPKMPS